MNLKTSLCIFSWIFLSRSDSHTVEVQPGQNVTLLGNKIKYSSTTTWFRLVNKTKFSYISRMTKFDVEYYQGYQGGKFKMESNGTAVFLNIKQVDVSDSGLYFCESHEDGGSNFSAIHLNVKDRVMKTTTEQHDDVDGKCKNEADGITKLTSVILGSLTVFLLMVIIGLVVKNRKRQTAHKEEQSPEQREDMSSDDLNYAAVKFQPRARRREPEPHVIYASTR